ncbi:MAG: aminopeptidase, partial [Solirubrobacteraceae bacterium]
MIDADKFAALLCDWSLQARAGEQVLIGSSTLALELVRALHRELLARGAWPLLRIAPPWQGPDFYRHALAEQLDGYAAVELTEAQGADVSLQIDAPANTRALADVDPELIARAARARQPVRDARLARRWAITQWPTAALAQQAGVGEDAYAAFLSRALFLDRPDPVAAWRELSVRQQALVARLSQAREIRIEAEGTDLRLRVDGRRWINSDGRRNMPSGEVFTGPHERSANGTITFTIPSSPRGVEVADVQLRFADGEVVAASAARGEAYLRAALATDAGARAVGELGIGTNPGIDRPSG